MSLVGQNQGARRSLGKGKRSPVEQAPGDGTRDGESDRVGFVFARPPSRLASLRAGARAQTLLLLSPIQALDKRTF